MATNRIGIRIATACLALACVGSAGADVLVTPGGIRFTYEGPNARKVSVAGTFNNWNANANPMVAEAGGVWSAVVPIGAGTHEYKFVIDGQWVADPGNPVTTGDFGNSALALDDRGRIVEMAATANTPYSAKILMTGRTIGTYRSEKNPANGDRYELRRPNLNTDLQFGIRVNDVLKATVLTNINNESEVELYRTKLNFDRGLLDFEDGPRRIRAWDNFDVGTWDDPLHLVGNVGIYSHAFGYGTQGAEFEQSWRGWTGRFLFADNFTAGPTTSPANDVFYSTAAALGSADAFAFWQLDEDGRIRVADTLHRSYDFNDTSNDEDVVAGRVNGEVGPVRVGASARLDRGYHPASHGRLEDVRDRVIALSDTVSLGRPDTLLVPATSATRTFFPSGTEQWRGFGMDFAWDEPSSGVEVRTEAMWGRAEFVGRNGRRDQVFVATLPESLLGEPRGLFASFDGDSIVTTDELDVLDRFEPVGTQKVDLDDSWRFFLGVGNLPPVLGVEPSASFEVQTHDFRPEATGLDASITNEMYVYRVGLKRPVTGRARAELALESFDFRYDRRSPWENQFWFDSRNFWLENGEHTVAYERLVLLGDDAIFWRPSLDVDVFASPRIRFEYDGTFAATGFTREPKYTETLLRASWLVRPEWELNADLRFVKYNDRILDLNDAYNETFLELKHEIAEGVEIALSYGVDPWALDGPVNEYGYIGRDVFLFARGANAGTARDDYYGLARAIRGAESALANARLLQLEAMLRF